MPQPIRSFWLKQALSQAPPTAPALEQDISVDVCIVGGGFTGLWTALHIKEQDPSVRVVIIERDVCGSGASGRNGGFCMSWMSKATGVLSLAGSQEGVRLLTAFADGVARIGQFCEEHQIDAEFRKDGWLWTATNRAQLDSWRPTIDVLDTHGLHPFEIMSREEVQQRSGSRLHLSGVFEAGIATLQPAKLARGLARVATERGVVIHEHSPMRELVRSAQPVVRTERGSVKATTVVLALNAWAHELPDFRRALLAIGVDAMITEPVPELLKRIGYQNGMAVSDSRLKVDYYRTTPDGRLSLGKGGGEIPFAGRVGANFDSRSERSPEIHERLIRLYPELRDVPIAAAWQGPASRTANGMPYFGRLHNCPRVIYGHGYNGNGVGPSYTGGRILASMTLDRDDEWSNTPLVLRGKPTVFLPAEPVRYLGSKIVRAAVERKTRLEDAGLNPGKVTRALSTMVPGGLTPQPTRNTKER